MISEADIEKMRQQVLDKCKQRDENVWVVVNKTQNTMLGSQYVFSIHHSNRLEHYIVEENPFDGVSWRKIG
jgi:uncharacterized protein (DUF39 family)